MAFTEYFYNGEGKARLPSTVLFHIINAYIEGDKADASAVFTSISAYFDKQYSGAAMKGEDKTNLQIILTAIDVVTDADALLEKLKKQVVLNKYITIFKLAEWRNRGITDYDTEAKLKTKLGF